MPVNRERATALSNELGNVPLINNIKLYTQGHPASLIGRGIMKRV